MNRNLGDVSHQLRPLAEAEVRYIVLHKQFASPEQLDAWRNWLTFEPCHEDEDLIVYRTDPRLGRDFVLAHEMTEGIGLIRAAFSPNNITHKELMYIDARWGSTIELTEDYEVCLKLVNAQGEAAQVKCGPLLSEEGRYSKPTYGVVREEYFLRIPPSLEPGMYSLTLVLASGTTGEEVGYPVVLGALTVK
jgi:hypothetical protein